MEWMNKTAKHNEMDAQLPDPSISGTDNDGNRTARNAHSPRAQPTAQTSAHSIYTVLSLERSILRYPTKTYRIHRVE